ncbi:2Fe-2S iron-sulfur cluster-binding protein [Pseudomonas sp. BN607]|uniref:2Fe-2S iron-sulfur cluster-binding protein n=1 Tax=Pseudomonas sp. BN607 TaxID=2567895 RepID=UPI0024590BDC|nr:2Fe-2S iron-sulfur cluster-binding protein [Pseudomonas sp. BN607]MDH4549899.1 2Fe-2S iron-sulfur cluster binding domain-containing protein [Pseudomonas sp. BN607]
MPKATFVLPDNSVQEMEVPIGTSLMQIAVSQGMHEIVGDCGGSASCATCHVYVEGSWLGKLTPMTDNENQMLECTSAPRQANSRLSCQIIMSTALDGIEVRVAESQW